MAPSTIDLHTLVETDQAPPEQILANAMQLYAALPPAARTALLDTLRSPDPAAHTALTREIVRTVLAFQLKTRRDALIRDGNGGQMPDEAPLDLEEDAALGDEAVRLVKESRELRAAQRTGR